MSATWHIVLTITARAQLRAITDARARKTIINRIDALRHEPERRGKPLLGELSGYYTLRAAGQRYRIIYRLERETIVVSVVAVGLRKEGNKNDIYTLARRLFRQGLLAPDDEPPQP